MEPTQEQAPQDPKTQMIGWSDQDVEQLGDRHAALEPVVLDLQRQQGIRIRCAGGQQASVGILDAEGRWIPQDAATREWGVAKAALLLAGFTVAEDGTLAAAAPADPKPAGRRSRGAAAEV